MSLVLTNFLADSLMPISFTTTEVIIALGTIAGAILTILKCCEYVVEKIPLLYRFMKSIKSRAKSPPVPYKLKSRRKGRRS